MDFNEFVNDRMEGMLESYEKMQVSKELLALESLAEFAEEYEYLEEGKLASFVVIDEDVNVYTTYREGKVIFQN